MPLHSLTQDERSAIQTMKAQAVSQADMARALGRSPSTISRELRRNRNGDGSYCATVAGQKYKKRKQRCRRTLLCENEKLVSYVYDKLSSYWSPEQIAGRLLIDFPDDPQMRISHETLYRWIYDNPKFRAFRECLRRRHKKRRKQGGRNVHKVSIPNRVPIAERPPEVDSQERFGDWEADLVLGAHQQGVIVTLVERKSMLLRVAVLPSKHAEGVADGAIEALLDMPKSWLRTITYDNGREFCSHEKVAKALGVKSFFADPYASQQRGKNENTNGLLRQYLPKKTSFKDLTLERLLGYVNEINDRPRKNLGYRSPREVFNYHNVAIRI